jgi:hypothetical protein
MGCRGTIEIWNNAAAPKSDERPVVLYTHDGAKRMLYNLITALSRKERWNDAPYLSRMIFCEMMGDYTHGTTGYGILTDNVPDVEEELLVDMGRQEVIRKRIGHDNQTFTFEELIDD